MPRELFQIRKSSSTESSISSAKTLILVVLCILAFDELRQGSGLRFVPTQIPTQNTGESHLLPCPAYNISYFPSSLNNSVRAQKFQIVEGSIKCFMEAKEDQKVAIVEFDIRECPPGYHQSSFHLASNDTHSRIMGHVGKRSGLREGCGYYQAKVPIMLPSIQSFSSHIQLHWMSDQAGSPNRLSDTDANFKLFGAKGSRDKLEQLFSEIVNPDRLMYLSSFWDDLGGFGFHWKNHDDNNDRSKTKHCHEIPMANWKTPGVFHDPDQLNNGNSSMILFGNVTNTTRMALGFAECHLKQWIKQDLNEELSGLRIFHLGDSHGDRQREQWIPRICPEVDPKDFHSAKFMDDCPTEDPIKMPWMIQNSLYRGVYRDEKRQDGFDRFTRDVRLGSTSACTDFLGLGSFNVTVISFPSWLYVYETNEGLENYLISLESLFQMCKQIDPSIFNRHIFLIQTSFAAKVEAVDARYINKNNVWRGIHNYQIERYSQLVTEMLGQYVDGVVPIFDATYARLSSLGEILVDGLHHQEYTYSETVDLLFAAIITSLRTHKTLGGEHALDEAVMKKNPRWWTKTTL